MSAQCPQCKAQVTLTGKIYNQIDYINPPAYFRPSSLPFYAVFKSNVQFQNNFYACSFCGLIWTIADNQELQQIGASREPL
jgi:rubredoxin